jgi:hypothetical protein
MHKAYQYLTPEQRQRLEAECHWALSTSNNRMRNNLPEHAEHLVRHLGFLSRVFSMRIIASLVLLHVVGISALAESYFVNVGDKQIEIPVPMDAVMAKGLDARIDHMMQMADSSNIHRLTYFVDPQYASAIRRGDLTGAPKLMYIVSCTPVTEGTDYKSSEFASLQDRMAQTMPDISQTLGPAISSYTAKANDYVQEVTGTNTKLEFSQPEALGILNRDSWSITTGTLTKGQFQDPKTNARRQNVTCSIESIVCARNRLLILSCRSMLPGPETIGSDLSHVLAWRDKVLEMNPNTP